jgi:hypothetical protein
MKHRLESRSSLNSPTEGLFSTVFSVAKQKQQIQIRRESNDADRSPSYRKAIHLLHSTRQKPGGSVVVHRDVKFANVLLQLDDEGRVREESYELFWPILVWHVFIRISTKVAPALA